LVGVLLTVLGVHEELLRPFVDGALQLIIIGMTDRCTASRD